MNACWFAPAGVSCIPKPGICDDTSSVPAEVMFGKVLEAELPLRRRERVAAARLAVLADDGAGLAIDLHDGVRIGHREHDAVVGRVPVDRIRVAVVRGAERRAAAPDRARRARLGDLFQIRAGVVEDAAVGGDVEAVGQARRLDRRHVLAVQRHLDDDGHPGAARRGASRTRCTRRRARRAGTPRWCCWSRPPGTRRCGPGGP